MLKFVSLALLVGTAFAGCGDHTTCMDCFAETGCGWYTDLADWFLGKCLGEPAGAYSRLMDQDKCVSETKREAINTACKAINLCSDCNGTCAWYQRTALTDQCNNAEPSQTDLGASAVGASIVECDECSANTCTSCQQLPGCNFFRNSITGVAKCAKEIGNVDKVVMSKVETCAACGLRVSLGLLMTLLVAVRA